MSAAIERYDDRSTVELSTDQVDLIKRTIAKDATNDELALFVQQCNRTGLDPFAKQIYFQKRSGKVIIITAIDGLRLIAERSNKYAGQDGPWWCGKDGEWHDTWFEAAPPAAAKVIVRKVQNGVLVETPAIAHYDEYVVKYNGKPGDMWAKMPRNQLAKCAEALALRKAFPAEMSGLYTDDEMAQADNDVPVVQHVAHTRPPEMARVEDTKPIPEAGEPSPPSTGTRKRKPPTAAKAANEVADARTAADVTELVDGLREAGEEWVQAGRDAWHAAGIRSVSVGVLTQAEAERAFEVLSPVFVECQKAQSQPTLDGAA